VDLARATGACGLGAMVVLFGAVIAIGSVGEPPLNASTEEAAEFIRNASADWVQAAGALASLGMLAFLWFVVGPALLLRRIEGEPAWRSGIALVSGVLLAAYGVLDASWDAASHRAADIDAPTPCPDPLRSRRPAGVWAANALQRPFLLKIWGR